MGNWPQIPFTKCTFKHAVTRNNQVKSSEVKVTGRYPVVDQGQSFIAGYTDDKSKLVEDSLPYIIFGDHTRCFKYVDFPFALGADGTKVLKPHPDFFSARFFYYAMLSLDIANRGYNRHFKLLKEKFVPKPPLPEQRRIAAVLSLVQRVIEQQERLIALNTDLKKALMHKFFTEGTHGEPPKQTEIGPVPNSWRLSRIGDMCRLRTGGTPSRNVPEFWGGKIPWIKTGEVDNCFINGTGEYITEAALNHSNAKIFPKGTLLVAMYGQGITRGKVGIMGIAAATNQACAAIIPYDSRQLSTEYLFYFLQLHYEELRNRGHGANQKNLSMTLIKAFPVVYPDENEQQEIVSTLSNADRKIQLQTFRLNCFRDLFRTLLHQLMTAEIRVNDLDLKELGLDIEE
jgi:type I restriction enzyme, S subunit